MKKIKTHDDLYNELEADFDTPKECIINDLLNLQGQSNMLLGDLKLEFKDTEGCVNDVIETKGLTTDEMNILYTGSFTETK